MKNLGWHSKKQIIKLNEYIGRTMAAPTLL